MFLHIQSSCFWLYLSIFYFINFRFLYFSSFFPFFIHSFFTSPPNPSLSAIIIVSWILLLPLISFSSFYKPLRFSNILLQFPIPARSTPFLITFFFPPSKSHFSFYPISYFFSLPITLSLTLTSLIRFTKTLSINTFWRLSLQSALSFLLIRSFPKHAFYTEFSHIKNIYYFSNTHSSHNSFMIQLWQIFSEMHRSLTGDIYFSRIFYVIQWLGLLQIIAKQ